MESRTPSAAPSHARSEQALPDRRKPVKARAARARLRRLAALTGSRLPGFLPPSGHGSQ